MRVSRTVPGERGGEIPRATRPYKRAFLACFCAASSPIGPHSAHARRASAQQRNEARLNNGRTSICC